MGVAAVCDGVCCCRDGVIMLFIVSGEVTSSDDDEDVDGSCAVDDGSCAADDGGCAADDGGCAADDGGCAADHGSCAADDGSCATDDGSCAVDDGSCDDVGSQSVNACEYPVDWLEMVVLLNGKMPHLLKPPLAVSGSYFIQIVDSTSGKSLFERARCSRLVKLATAEYHDAFMGLNTPTSNGCKRCVRCDGNFSIWMLF